MLRLLSYVELTAVGVSASMFNLVSKLINVPLLNITTSFVSEERGLVGKAKDSSRQIRDDFQGEKQSKKSLPSASTSLALAASIGIAEVVALFLGSGVLMDAMGFTNVDTCRAISFPKGIWWSTYCDCTCCTRNISWIKDTKKPFNVICAGNLLNAGLDGILIFILNFGIGGAAVATVISEYVRQ